MSVCRLEVVVLDRIHLRLTPVDCLLRGSGRVHWNDSVDGRREKLEILASQSLICWLVRGGTPDTSSAIVFKVVVDMRNRRLQSSKRDVQIAIPAVSPVRVVVGIELVDVIGAVDVTCSSGLPVES